MTIDIHQHDPFSTAADLVVLFQLQGSKGLSGAVKELDGRLEGALVKMYDVSGFEGKEGDRLTFPGIGKIKPLQVAIFGLGKKETLAEDAFRKLGGQIARLANDTKSASLIVDMQGLGGAGVPLRSIGQAFTEGLLLSDYRFHAYKGRHFKKEQKSSLATVRLHIDKKQGKAVLDGVSYGVCLAGATMLARDLVNAPSSDMTPSRLAAEAKKMAKPGSGIQCKILDQKTMEKMGMRAALAVARGSMHPPVGVHLIYKPKKSKKSIALVGKAVTFDSGGLSIKPADGMMTMKIDMAGAASVIGIFKALSVLKPNVTVHGIFLAVENMPSGSAYRPGDVVTAMDGTTIEVLNTDAEGRVTLADALSYARGLKPDMMIDLATLTGACVVALGEEVAGLMSNDEKLTQKLLAAAQEAGEPLWQLPLYGGYNRLIKSKLADIKNIGGKAAGAITAGLFLKTFVEDIPWAHLDIAGPSYTEHETRPDLPYGATGYGVRLLVKFLEGI